ncbi:MAG: pilus assembly protein TadG-related protein [Propionibacteriaceae bacterium]|nr:pilus assembly protein TadG-related protein [Propionibacteriaceae bacterium]
MSEDRARRGLLTARGSERGIGTVLTAFVIGMLALCVVGGLVGYTWVHARHEAQAASDLAALAAAQGAAFGDSDAGACGRAGQVATANGAHLLTCEVVQALDQVGVKVVVRVNIDWFVPGLPGSVDATAYAGNPEK